MGVAFNTTTHLCCSGTLITLEVPCCLGVAGQQYDDDCCDSDPYNTDTYQCCGNETIPIDDLCCGDMKGDIGDDMCCNNTEPYNSTTQFCCFDTVIEGKLLDLFLCVKVLKKCNFETEKFQRMKIFSTGAKYVFLFL